MAYGLPTDTWILVCDSAHARIYINHGPNDGVHESSEINTSIPQAGELVTNSRGRNKPGNRFQMRHAYEPPSDARKLEKAAFVKDVAETINSEEKNIPRLIIAAPPEALHTLRTTLSDQVKKKIIAEIDKDLTNENERSLPKFLEDHMAISA